MRRAGVIGVVLWLVGTAGIRLAGYRLLQPDQPVRTLVLYVISFALMVALGARIVAKLRLKREERFQAIALVMLPTLVLDPFSSLYFGSVFPNIDVRAAGAFGGWMLICCAGAVVGTWIKR